MAEKPKKNQPQTPDKQQTRDLFQTPRYAVDLIVPYLCKYWSIWEPCCGQGKIVTRLSEQGFGVQGTDIADYESNSRLSYSKSFDVLKYNPSGNHRWDCAITNPPFSIKEKIAKRFIELEKPFALLVPGDWSIWMVDLMRKYNCQLIVPSRRINYITPTGKQGKKSSAQFHSVWLTRMLNISYQDVIKFVELSKQDMLNI